ncbi:unnamed protein product [Ilex paraguariensis]|uniref:Uncharacterized protein n=1 Tax=Ilex paraguariensis TaxID=185542 RepID=A0ABC8UZG6_9AQUA
MVIPHAFLNADGLCAYAAHSTGLEPHLYYTPFLPSSSSTPSWLRIHHAAVIKHRRTKSKD